MLTSSNRLLALFALLGQTVIAGGAESPPVLSGSALLQKAVQANGGMALRTLTSMDEHAQVHYRDENGYQDYQFTEEAWTGYEQARQRYRSLNRLNEWETTLITAQGSAFYRPATGTVPMPRQYALDEFVSLLRGVGGLKLNLQPGHTLRNEGLQRWDMTSRVSLRGTVLSTTFKGQTVQYLLNEKGELLADRQAMSDGEQSTRVYLAHYWQQGLRLPGRWQEYWRGSSGVKDVQNRQILLNIRNGVPVFDIPGLTSTPLPQLPLSTVTAQDVFDEITFRIAQSYDGFSPVNLRNLRLTYQKKLTDLCATRNPCPPALAQGLYAQLLGDLQDRHSSYLNPNAYQATKRTLKGESGQAGLGAIMIPAPSGELVIVHITPHSVADQQGWKAGDIITHIDGHPSYTAPAREAYQRFLQGEMATFTLQRQGTERVDTLQPAQLPSAPVTLIVRPDGIAVLELRDFMHPKTAQLLHDAVRQGQRQGAWGLILDLRFNSGGQMWQTMLSTQAFTDPPPEITQNRYYTTRLAMQNGALQLNGQPLPGGQLQHPARYDGLMVVLTSSASASGAEYLARALLNRPGTTLIGMATSGLANTRTTIFELLDGSALWLTNGRVLDAAGQPLPERVEPHAQILLNMFQLVETGQDSMIEQAVDILKVSR